MQSIRSKFTMMTAISIIISVVAVGIVSMHFIRRITRDYLDELLMLKCTSIEEQLDSYLNGIEQCVDTIAYYAGSEADTELWAESAPEEAEADSNDIDEYVREIDLLFYSEVSTNSGVLTYYFRLDPAAVGTDKGFWYSRHSSRYGSGAFESLEPDDHTLYDEDDKSHTSWFYTPNSKGHAVWISPYNNDVLSGTKIISYVAPVYSRGEFIGALGIDYDFETFKEHLRYEGNFEGAYTFLTDENGKIIYHPELESGTSVAEMSAELLSDKSRDGQTVIKVDYNGKEYRVTYEVLANNMRVYLVVPETSYKSYWLRFARAFLLCAALILVLFVGVSLVMTGRITKPLTELTEAAKKIDKGDYDVELTYDSDNEIGILTGAFRQLIRHLKIHIQDLNEKAYRDALTSVRNKGAFDIYIQKLEDGIRYTENGLKPEFAICVFDCNDLKQINDSYGHDKGDIFIKNACRVICEVFAHSPVFRLGGDEFGCILQGSDYRNRVRLCTEFERVCMEKTEAADKPWNAVNIAGGIAVFDPDSDESAADVFKRADRRMYEDKNRKKQGIIRELPEEILSAKGDSDR